MLGYVPKCITVWEEFKCVKLPWDFEFGEVSDVLSWSKRSHP